MSVIVNGKSRSLVSRSVAATIILVFVSKGERCVNKIRAASKAEANGLKRAGDICK